ncbi:hypothetical protein L596_005396 [Steinernema carpocapsae]|uniref:Uncharacterized protein n=1 Tax=Steinernema carpocapsae TaxID=34508 RepID=A0A4U8UZ50_STECR|nr:hypothetical protein L596_005396 [Steinernema carpocapsae]
MQSSRFLLPFARAGVVSQTAAISTTVPSCTNEMHRFRSPVLPSNRVGSVGSLWRSPDGHRSARRWHRT